VSDAENREMLSKQRPRRKTMLNLRVGHSGLAELLPRDHAMRTVRDPADDPLRRGI
jgi:hypothetical protein